MMQTIEFENTLQERVQELKFKLKESINLRESDILINEIDTLESILGRLSYLKYSDKVRAMEIAEANYDFKQAIEAIVMGVAQGLKERGVNVGGVLSREIRTNNVRTGFVFIDLATNDRDVLASITGNGPMVGKYFVNLSGCRFAVCC